MYSERNYCFQNMVGTGFKEGPDHVQYVTKLFITFEQAFLLFKNFFCRKNYFLLTV